MAYVAYSTSPIHVRETGGAVDPGYGQGGPGIDNSLPHPPPGVWPPPVPAHPIVPAPPDTPPGVIWPPAGGMPYPDQGLPGSQPHPDQGLPGSPPRPDNTLPDGKFWVVAGIPGYGWRYICVDPSLSIDNTLPGGSGGRPDNTLPSEPGHPANRPPGQGAPSRPDNTLPPTAEPKR